VAELTRSFIFSCACAASPSNNTESSKQMEEKLLRMVTFSALSWCD
jgi:hypothetical protein